MVDRKLVAGRPKAALLFWFFGDFKCCALLFMVILVIYKCKNRYKYLLNVRLAGDHLYGKLLFTWLSLVMYDGVFFLLSFFPRDVLDEILNLTESVSEGFPTYSYRHKQARKHCFSPPRKQFVYQEGNYRSTDRYRGYTVCKRYT